MRFVRPCRTPQLMTSNHLSIAYPALQDRINLAFVNIEHIATICQSVASEHPSSNQLRLLALRNPPETLDGGACAEPTPPSISTLCPENSIHAKNHLIGHFRGHLKLTDTDRKFDSAWGGGAGSGGLGGGGRLATHVGPPLRLLPPAVRRLWPIPRSHPGTPGARGPPTGNMGAV